VFLDELRGSVQARIPVQHRYHRVPLCAIKRPRIGRSMVVVVVVVVV
jgi:hypothetical protein